MIRGKEGRHSPISCILISSGPPIDLVVLDRCQWVVGISRHSFPFCNIRSQAPRHLIQSLISAHCSLMLNWSSYWKAL